MQGPWQAQANEVDGTCQARVAGEREAGTRPGRGWGHAPDRAAQAVKECWGSIRGLDLCFEEMSPVVKGT